LLVPKVKTLHKTLQTKNKESSAVTSYLLMASAISQAKCFQGENGIRGKHFYRAKKLHREEQFVIIHQTAGTFPDPIFSENLCHRETKMCNLWY